ncbi:MAG TPA: sigma-54 dependent transcriptional regulator [Bacteroidia bacterium]|nr:sigma-54 dependent transcriptional regulator [Bacteroidia bacterium]
MSKRILIADDDTDICNLLSRFLKKQGFETEIAFRGITAIEALKNSKFDLMLCDFRLGDMDGIEVLSKMHIEGIRIPVIIITGYSDIKMAVNVIKAGAFDYVTKPLIPDEILLTIKRAMNEENLPESDSNETAVTKNTSRKSSNSEHLINGKSEKARELLKQIELVAPTNYSVIIYGESGSGKEAVARSIHDKSARKNQPFVAMDCGAISKELAGSELFGHEKGSFTGALGTKIGHFELANGGTLFLDEVANLSYDIQVSLLRVVQERKMKRIGGNKVIELDVRIVIASNENLIDAYKRGKFREDLFHRFNEFTIMVPPLRNRGTDIMIFSDFFLNKANAELNKSIQGFSNEVKEAFNNYRWPGNIRELKNIIKRAALLTNDDTIGTDAVPAEILNPFAESPMELQHETNIKYRSDKNSNEQPVIKNLNVNLKEAALEAEFETIMNVLKKVKYNKSKAARLLNIDRKTLYNKMKHYNMLGDKEEAE